MDELLKLVQELVDYLKLSQEDLKYYLYFLLCEKNMNPVYREGFLYGEGNIPVLLVAHLDTVSEEPPTMIQYIVEEDKLYNPDGILGGDDRCGVYAIMKLLDVYRPHVLFTEDEEKDKNGAWKAVCGVRNPKEKFKYIIEIDRRNKDDAVYYDCGNYDFMAYVKNFGYKKNYGSSSDISILGRVWDIAAVNVSAGFHEEHTNNEYVAFRELVENILRVEKMLKDIENAPYFDYKDLSPEYDDMKIYRFKNKEQNGEVNKND
jgi:di/tripeptidase